MKLSVQVVLHADEGTETVVHEVFHLDSGPLTPDSLGLGLAEAKDLLAAVQSALVTEQVSAGVAAQVACPHCGRPRRHGGRGTTERKVAVVPSVDASMLVSAACLGRARR
jgi:hypothetical protein